MAERARIALPNYEIGKEIGRGGCGAVLFGTHRHLHRNVAIKQIIPADFNEDDDFRRRFAAEAKVMASIDHPHVVPVYDYVEHDDLCLLVLEYLPGGTVQSRFSSTGFDITSAIAVALACAAGLEAAHRKGILHRDVKPANLMFTEDGIVKLGDFGIAKILGDSGTMHTRTGFVLGTAAYIAPEQVREEKLSPATDIYALSTMLYQLLSGMLPFPPCENQAAMLVAHVVDKPIPLSSVASSIPSPIADVVMRGLATNPDERWCSAEEFSVALTTAANASWNTDWLARSEVPVIGSDSPTSSLASVSYPPTTTGSRPASTPDSAAVKPVQRPSRTGATLLGSDFKSPRVPYIIAAVLAIAAGVLAFVGLGAPPHGGDLKPGMVTIAGVDPVTATEVSIDMSKPIPVTVTGMPGDTASLSLTVLGFSLGNHDAPLGGPGPALAADVPDPLNPYIVAGKMSGELRISNVDGTSTTYRFGIRSTQPATTTAVAAGVVVLALFAFAYIESYTRTLRRGRHEVSAWVGLPLATALLVVAAVGALWVLTGREPTMDTLVACAAIGVAAGLSTTIGATRRGDMNRYRRHRTGPQSTMTANTTRITGGNSNPNTTGSRRISGWLKIGAGSEHD